ncbi:MAG: MFS transporter [Kiritimatiellales bacterium]
MRLFKLKKTVELRPDLVNECNQVTDKSILGKDRLKFGVGSVMYQSEETAFVPVHTVVVRALGGADVYLGLISAVVTSSGALMQWVGAVLLRRFRSNKKAMRAALSAGVFFGTLLVALMLVAGIFPALRVIICLPLYILFVFGLAGASGVQGNIEVSWIGDLVPLSMRGWFTSMKWVISALGVLTLMLLFGQIAQRWPYFGAYAILFLCIALSHVLAIWLMNSVTDRIPQPVSFISSKSDVDQVNYLNPKLWNYIWFYVCWAGGRTAMLTFTTAYMLDYLNYSMGRIVLIFGLTNLINIVMLLIMGKVSDKCGTRRPLAFISGGMGLCMVLWVSSAWLGVWPIILYQFINGAAGSTHMMLSTNYGLEIFPEKGRAAYFAIARMFIGISSMAAAVIGGMIMSRLRGWHITLWGAEFNHYHIFFLGCSLFTVGCVIPLIIEGISKKKQNGC